MVSIVPINHWITHHPENTKSKKYPDMPQANHAPPDSLNLIPPRVASSYGSALTPIPYIYASIFVFLYHSLENFFTSPVIRSSLCVFLLKLSLCFSKPLPPSTSSTEPPPIIISAVFASHLLLSRRRRLSFVRR